MNYRAAQSQENHLLSQWEDKGKTEKSIAETNEFFMFKNPSNACRGGWHISKTDDYNANAICGQNISIKKRSGVRKKLNKSEDPQAKKSFGKLCGKCLTKWQKEVLEK